MRKFLLPLAAAALLSGCGSYTIPDTADNRRIYAEMVVAGRPANAPGTTVTALGKPLCPSSGPHRAEGRISEGGGGLDVIKVCGHIDEQPWVPPTFPTTAADRAAVARKWQRVWDMPASALPVGM
jgi:uncharacterized protein YceK